MLIRHNNCLIFIRVYFLCLILAISLLNMVWPEKYTAKSWAYASLLDGAVSYPHWYLRAVTFGIGLPNSCAIGTTLFEAHIMPCPPQMTTIGCLPVSIYYVPYANWHKNGIAAPIIYTNLSMNMFGSGPYLWMRIGVAWLCAGLETGWISCPKESIFSGSIYGGITLSLGGWFATDIKKQNQ